MFVFCKGLIESLQHHIDKTINLSEIPSSQRRAKPKSINEYEKNTNERNQAIVEAYKSGGYTLKEIGDYFKLHYSTVSGIIKNHKSKT